MLWKRRFLSLEVEIPTFVSYFNLHKQKAGLGPVARVLEKEGIYWEQRKILNTKCRYKHTIYKCLWELRTEEVICQSILQLLYEITEFFLPTCPHP